MHYNEALRTPQFYLLWTAVLGNAVAGVTIISSAKTIMSDVFHSALPMIVTGVIAVNLCVRYGNSNATVILL